MPTLLEKEIDRAVDGRLSSAPRPVPATPAAPPRRAAAPVVRFSPLFDEPPVASKRKRRNLIVISVTAHVVLFVAVWLMPQRALSIVEPVLPMQIVFTAQVPEIHEPVRAPAPPKPKAKPEPAPAPRELPKPEIAEAPKPKPVIPEVVAPPVAKVEPPRPRPVVRTGLLDEATAGPPVVASKTSRSAVVAVGFDGTGSVAGSPGRPGGSGRVVEAAFDTAPAISGKTSRGTHGAVQATGFSDEVAAAPKKREREQQALDLDGEVEILSKPKPVYTEEARSLRIEGDVVLDVTFTAAGVLRVLGVAAGLGHGLDEAAIDAAKKIRFNPAKRDGGAVDHTAKLRVVFRLA